MSSSVSHLSEFIHLLVLQKNGIVYVIIWSSDVNLFKKVVISTVSLGLLLPSTAFAGEFVGKLDSVSGDVMIERAGEFLRAETNSNILQGDRVVVLPGAFAKVRLVEGCTKQINEASVINVGEENYCSNIVQVAELTAKDNFAGKSISTLNLEGGDSVLVYLLGAGILIAAGVAVSGGGGNSSPSSP